MFTTERLLLRKWKDEDKTIFTELNADVDVMAFFPSVLTRTESDVFADKIRDKINKTGWGLFAVEIKETNEFIGFIGLSIADFDSDFTPCLEMGWRLHKDYWNQGYATEGAMRVLDFALYILDETEIFSFTSILNLPSIAVMEKIGMEKIREFDHPKLELTDRLCRHVLYRGTR